MGFSSSSLSLAVILGVLAYLLGVRCQRQPELWRCLPRERRFGTIVACACLVWSAYHVCLMLEGDLVQWRIWVKMLVPVCTVLAYFFVDYLFTRALGGLLLLLVAQALHLAMAVHLPLRPLYSSGCYLVGVAAMFVVGWPWLFRDLLEKSARSQPWRRACLGVLGASAAFFAVFAALR